MVDIQFIVINDNNTEEEVFRLLGTTISISDDPLLQSYDVDTLIIDPTSFKRPVDFDNKMQDSISNMCALCVVIVNQNSLEGLQIMSRYLLQEEKPLPFVIFDLDKKLELKSPSYNSKVYDLGEMIRLYTEKDMVSFCSSYGNVIHNFFLSKESLMDNSPGILFQKVQDLVVEYSDCG